MSADGSQFDPAKTALKQEWKHSRPLTACHWEPRGRFVFFGAEDNLVHRVELASGKLTSRTAHDSWVRAFASSPDGQTLYTGGYDGRLLFWPVEDEQPPPQRTLDAHQGWIRAVAASPSGEWLASCGNDRIVRIWNASNGALAREFAGHAAHVYQVLFRPDSKAVFSCDLKGVVKMWPLDGSAPRDLVTVAALHDYDTTFRADIGGARGIALRTDGAQLALSGITNVSNAFAGVGDVAIALVHLPDGKLDRVLQTKDKTKGTMWGVAHHPAGYWVGLSGGSGGGWLFFWKTDGNDEFAKVPLKDHGRGLAVAPDHGQWAVAHADGFLRIYGA